MEKRFSMCCKDALQNTPRLHYLLCGERVGSVLNDCAPDQHRLRYGPVERYHTDQVDAVFAAEAPYLNGVLLVYVVFVDTY